MNDEEANITEKTVKFGVESLLGGGLKPDEDMIGRHIMTCCAGVFSLIGLVAKICRQQSLEHGGWVEITKVKKRYNDMYVPSRSRYTVLELKNPPIADEVATFY